MSEREIDAGLAAVRRRAGMYVGSRDGRGVQVLMLEVLSNAVDEHLAGGCGRIDVAVAEDGEISVRDDGRGFPLLRGGVEALRRRHDRPTFDGHAPHIHLKDCQGGGLAVVVALSARFRLWSGEGSAVAGERGRVGEVEAAEAGRGTRVSFLPDPEIFGGAQIDGGWLGERLRTVAALFPGLKLGLEDRRRQEFHAPEGVRALLEGPEPRWPHLQLEPVTTISADLPLLRVQAALGWAEDWPEPRLRSWVNGMPVIGGDHLTGLLRGVDEGFADLLLTIPARRRKAGAAWLRGRLVATVAIWMGAPTFEKPVQAVLAAPGVEEAIAGAVAAGLREALREQDGFSLSILEQLAR